MSKTKQDLAELNPALARLRAAKHASAQKYKPSTEELKMPSQQGNEANEDTLSGNQDDTPFYKGTVNDGGNEDPSNANDSLNSGSDNQDWQKRYGDAQRYIQQLKNELEEAKGSKEPVKLPKTDAELQAWMDKNPEQVDLLITLIGKQNESLVTELQSTKTTLDEIRKANRNEELFQEVLKTHPDAGQIRKSEKFKEWFATQSNGVRALIESDNANDISKGIAIFKNDVGINTSKSYGKSAEDADFINPKTAPNLPKDPKVWTASEISKLSPQQYDKYREEIKAAKREGRYDPTS